MNNETKKPSVRESFKDYVKDSLGKDVGALTDKQLSYALTKYYITQIHNRTKNNISEDDFERGYVDASNDLGVDFIHCDDHSVLIIQTKYARVGGSTDSRDIEHFQNVFNRLLDPKYTKNTKLGDAVSDVDFNVDSFNLRYLTLAKIDGQAEIQTRTIPHLPKNFIGLADRIDFEFLDESDLNQELRNALSLATGLPQENTLVAYGKPGRRSPVIEISAGDYRSCILVMSTQQIIDLYRQAKDSLFTLNIRNYIGKTATNKAIVKTAHECPKEFFHYNNGISCLATKLEIASSGDRVITQGIQVINGAQTVKSLFRAVQQRTLFGENDDALLLVRITEIPDGYGDDGRFRNNVIRYNNTQNVIKEPDFRSNDPIQNDLKFKFEKCKHYGKSIDYIPKRTDRIRPNAIAIRVEEFAKVVYSFLCDPVSFAAKTSFLFDDSEDGGYRSIFGDGKQVWDTMPDNEFKIRSAIWWMSDAFSNRLSDERKAADDSRVKLALERKYMLIFAARLILERSFGANGYQEYFSKEYEGEWKFGEKMNGKWFDALYSKAKGTVVNAYKSATKRQDFIHRNWMRSKDTIDELRDIVDDLIEPLQKPSFYAE